MVESLLRDFVPERFVDDLDFSTLELCSGDYVADNLSQRHNDIVWRIHWKEQKWLYLVLLLEFQSKQDPWMPLRMLSYTSLLLLKLVETKKILPHHPLPDVFPIVLYNGGVAWKVPLDVASLYTAPMSSRLQLYRPQHRYFLLDEKAVSPQTLQERGKGLAGILIRVEQAQGMEDVREAFRDMMQLLKGEESQSLQIAFIEWLQYVGQNIGIAEYIPKATNLQEFDAMLEENLLKWKARQEAAWKKEWSEEWSEEWKEKYLSEGRQEGRLEGRQEMLLDALEDRFGSLPKPVTAYIESEEDAQELRRLLRSAYRVESLEAFCKQIKVSLA
ncbi:hypothetical protein B5F76_05130 [Desulfovibrio sp. An276]|nr:hypothetical protein B5F76_05130 [Desulfovibrio sp. An276]